MTLSTADLRNKFIDYFKAMAASGGGSSLVPADDPTLFLQRGHEPFKDCF